MSHTDETTSASAPSAQGPEWGTLPVRRAMQGMLGFKEVEPGMVVPARFTSQQVNALQARGISSQASTTAGCMIDLMTNGDLITFPCKVVVPLDRSNPFLREIEAQDRLNGISDPELNPIDGFGVVAEDGSTQVLPARTGTIEINLNNPDRKRQRVRIYLPTSMGVALGDLRANGVLAPTPRPAGYLLALGDSIMQGFGVGNPALSVAALVSTSLGLGLLNQSAAGQVFSRSSLRGLRTLRVNPPAAIVVSMGTNDWASISSPATIRRNAERYLSRTNWILANTPIYVLSPLWRADEDTASACGRPLLWMDGMLRNVCSKRSDLHFVDGYHAIPRNTALFADGHLHPNAVGTGLVADTLTLAMAADGFGGLNVSHIPTLTWDTEDAAASTVGAADTADVASPGSMTDADDTADTNAGSTAVSRDASGEIDLDLGFFPASYFDRPTKPTPADNADAQTRQNPNAPSAHPDFDRLVRTIWRLRQPDGCPWDREQTHESIRSNFIEEAYEAVEAITAQDTLHLREELGDVLEQVLLHAQIARDDGEFDIDDVCRDLNDKLVRRHPHVFGTDGTGVASEDQASDGSEALDVWDSVKRSERADRRGGDASTDADDASAGLLDSIPISLPALAQCQKISRRTAKQGFEWASVDDVWDKVAEERAEFEREERGSEAATEEFGDLLFALVNVARHEGIDAEEALAASNRKFRKRWARMEEAAREQGVSLDALGTAALNDLWEQAKREEA